MQNDNLDNYSNDQQYNEAGNQQYNQTNNQQYYASDNQQYTSQSDQPDGGNGTRKALIIACCTIGILAAVLILLILGIMIINSGSKKVEEEVKKKVKEKVEEELDEELEDLEDDVKDEIKDKIDDVDEDTVEKAKEKAKGIAEDAMEAAEDENEKHRYDPRLREERESERPAEEERVPLPAEDERARETKPADENAAEAGLAEEEKPAASEAADYVWRGNSSQDFTVTLVDGSSFTLSKQAGKVVLVNFWTTWCGPCCREMPAFQWLYDDYDSDEVAILAINYGEDASSVYSFVSSNGYTFPVGYDTDGSVGSKYLGGSIPYTVVFNKDGTVYQEFVGASTAQVQYDKYKKAIDGALACQ